MNLSIRIAEIEDAESIAELSGQLGYESNKKAIQNRLVEILGSEHDCVFVALENDRILGWVHGFYARRVESDAFVEMGGLVVDEHARKKGIGKILVEKVGEWAESKGCAKLRVRCNAVRKETHVFYQNIGFELKKDQKIFDRQLKGTAAVNDTNEHTAGSGCAEHWIKDKT